ncbi:MAG: ATP-NAD kinase family protein [Euryarchaeota archaeon]|nr:ATP-NAD kinase family protein [Euryarchaeota archaeon]
MKRIGFLVNPIAGMGGRVGLKGTDGVLEEALGRGAHPVAPLRAKEALRELDGTVKKISIATSDGKMGGELLREMGIPNSVVYRPAEKTTFRDTQNTCKQFLEENLDLIIFCGGDGTARDIYEIIGDKIPLIGVPSGVKMFSGVFSVNPRCIPELINNFLDNDTEIREAEIMDIDEEKYRENVLDIKLFGYGRTIYLPNLVQRRKSTFQKESETESKRNIALFMRELMRDGALYIVGAGTTTKAIPDLMAIEKTLLGVDLVKNETIIAKDLSEKEILARIAEETKVRIVVSPIGAQGFLFGRGTQQISPEVIKKVGVENIIPIATPYKLSQTPNLMVDTGDEELDRKLSGDKTVVCGYRLAQKKKVLGGNLSQGN